MLALKAFIASFLDSNEVRRLMLWRVTQVVFADLLYTFWRLARRRVLT